MPKNPTALEHIRLVYAVPAKLGARVEYQGRTGVITGATGNLVRVRFPGAVYGIPIEPNLLLYLEDSDGDAAP